MGPRRVRAGRPRSQWGDDGRGSAPVGGPGRLMVLVMVYDEDGRCVYHWSWVTLWPESTVKT